MQKTYYASSFKYLQLLVILQHNCSWWYSNLHHLNKKATKKGGPNSKQLYSLKNATDNHVNFNNLQVAARPIILLTLHSCWTRLEAPKSSNKFITHLTDFIFVYGMTTMLHSISTKLHAFSKCVWTRSVVTAVAIQLNSTQLWTWL